MNQVVNVVSFMLRNLIFCEVGLSQIHCLLGLNLLWHHCLH